MTDGSKGSAREIVEFLIKLRQFQLGGAVPQTHWLTYAGHFGGGRTPDRIGAIPAGIVRQVRALQHFGAVAARDVGTGRSTDAVIASAGEAAERI
jgi:hypothetical protein